MPEEKLEIDWGDDKVQRTQRSIEKNPYDLESWSVLLREAQSRHISDMRPLYERLLTIFPNAARYWKIYIEHEIRVRNYEKAEKLFQRSLIKILNIDLWKLYLAYVKDTKCNLPSYKEKMAQAYDFALDKIGMDIHSYSIWNDYVNFLKSVDAIGSYAENQKISAIRKVYQRGIINPMLNIEQFWKDYIAFEQNINSILADKMSRERSKDYINARRVSKELEVQIRGINRNLPNIPPSGSTEELRQVELWRKYIAWEKSNPLRTEDLTLVVKRTLFAYEQCLLCLGHHPDIWYQATQFMQKSSKQLHENGDANSSKIFGDESANIFERAVTTLLTKNMLIYFAYADYEEIRMKYDKVHQIYQKFLSKQDIDPTLCYIQYMKFARRIEGIKSARNIFKLAREDSRSQFQVYIAAALMEYYCSKEKNIALRIFELGLKKYASEARYILAYVDYLSQLNDDNNTRVLFERILSSGSLDAENSVPVWNRFLELESNIGDLQTVMKIEKRRTDVLEKIRDFEGKEAAHLVDRYKFLDLFPCSPIELKTIGYGDIMINSLTNIPSAVLSTCFGHQIKSGDSRTSSSALEDDNWASHIPQPDLSQMIPYKPKLNALSHEHRIPGGVFQLPQAVSQLNSVLPPPQFYRGPYVSRDLLCDYFNRMILPDTCPDLVPTENGSSTKLFDLTRSVNWIQNDNPNVLKRKSKVATSNVSGSDDEGIQQPPVIDIYRMRQQKKARFNNMNIF